MADDNNDHEGWVDWLDWLAECEPIDSEDPDHYYELLRDEDML